VCTNLEDHESYIARLQAIATVKEHPLAINTMVLEVFMLLGECGVGHVAESGLGARLSACNHVLC
jgi:hypothetical protein